MMMHHPSMRIAFQMIIILIMRRNHIRIPLKIKIVNAIINDEEYIQCDFSMNDQIDDTNDSPFEPGDKESSGDVYDYVQAHL